MESAFISSRPDLPQKLIYFWKSYSFTCDFYSALNWKVCQAISSMVFCACEFSLLASSYGDLLDMYSLTPQSFHSLCSHFCQPLTVNSRFNSKGKEKFKKKWKGNLCICLLVLLIKIFWGEVHYNLWFMPLCNCN